VSSCVIQIDRGMGVSGDALLKFDIKRENKEHLASKAYTIKSLFSGNLPFPTSNTTWKSHISAVIDLLRFSCHEFSTKLQQVQLTLN